MNIFTHLNLDHTCDFPAFLLNMFYREDMGKNWLGPLLLHEALLIHHDWTTYVICPKLFFQTGPSVATSPEYPSGCLLAAHR
jgi:hypothetical protein